MNKKMFLSISLCLLTTLTAYADFSYILVDKLNINYNDPQGIADVNKILFPDGNFNWDTPQKLTIKKSGNDMQLDNGRQVFTIFNAPNFVMSVSKFELVNLNFVALEQDLDFSFDKFNLFSPDGDTLINNFHFQCKEGVNRSSYTFFDKIFEGCFTNSELESSRVTMIYRDNEKLLQTHLMQSIFNSINTIVSQKNQQQIQSESTNVMENIKFHMKKHSFSMEALVHAQLSGTVRMGGKGQFMQEEQQFKVQLDRATFGWFNILDQVFSELEKDTSGKIIVQRPNVFIKL